VKNAVVATIVVGANPYGVAMNPAGTRVYVANQGSSMVLVIDTATNEVTDTIAVGLGPRGVAVNPAGTRVYVGNSQEQSVSVIDTAANQIEKTIHVVNSPIGVAVNPAGTQVDVAGHHVSVPVIDTATKAVVATSASAAPRSGSPPDPRIASLAGRRSYGRRPVAPLPPSAPCSGDEANAEPRELCVTARIRTLAAARVWPADAAPVSVSASSFNGTPIPEGDNSGGTVTVHPSFTTAITLFDDGTDHLREKLFTRRAPCQAPV